MTDGSNRALWIIIGFLLAAAGGFGILAHLGRLPFPAADEPLLSRRLTDLWQRGDPWNLAVVIAVGLLAAVLGLVLLRREFRRRGATRIDDLTHPGEHGSTVVRASGLIHGLERDVARGPGIGKVAATITGRAETPRVWLRVALAPGARLEPAREHVDAALRRLTTTSGLDPTAVDVTVLPTGKSAARVH